MIKHEQIEKNVGLLIVLTLLVVLWGGLLEIVPLFFQIPRHRDGLGSDRRPWQTPGFIFER
jgi:cbb3-type cytochrome oxidase cytochrome c subunit